LPMPMRVESVKSGTSQPKRNDCPFPVEK
jgi:hypothetical protein